MIITLKEVEDRQEAWVTGFCGEFQKMADALSRDLAEKKELILLKTLDTAVLKKLNDQISIELANRGVNSRKVRQYVEGQMIGKLTIISELKECANETGYGIKQFNCLCSCTNFCKRSANYLTEQKEKACCPDCGNKNLRTAIKSRKKK